MNYHPDFTKGKQKANEATVAQNKEWEQLTFELNSMGPPAKFRKRYLFAYGSQNYHSHHDFPILIADSSCHHQNFQT